MRHPFAYVVLALLVAGTRGSAEDAPATAVAAARIALEQAMAQASRDIAKATKDGVVAWTDIRPTVDDPAAAERAARLQSAMVPALLREGVLLLPFEAEHPIASPYRNGKLPAGTLLGPDDGTYLTGRGATFLIVPELVDRPTSDALSLDVYDLAKGKKALSTGVGPIATKKVALNEQIPLDILPPRNVKVLLFAIANLGRQVDRGECWDLPAHPVLADGGTIDGYRFGTEVAWEHARPGDVITFGTGGASGGHVTVLWRYAPTRAGSTVLHQNVNGVRTVVFGSLGQVESGKAGQKLAIWRP